MGSPDFNDARIPDNLKTARSAIGLTMSFRFTNSLSGQESEAFDIQKKI